MSAFIAQREGVSDLSHELMASYADTADTFFAPFIEAMHLEGHYELKIPCYNANLVNPDTPKECARGSPWVTEAQKAMGGDIAHLGVNLNFFDNFHRVYVTTPHHLPQVNNTCPQGGPHPCSLNGLTVSETFYDRLQPFDSGFDVQAATEHKAKMVSRESIQWHAGNTNANFDQLDNVDTVCQGINQMAINWGVSKASSKAQSDYNTHGKKLVAGLDLKPAGAGPEWIWTYIQYNDNAAKTQTEVRSPTMRLPMNYWEIEVQGNHYCKLLSPYRVLEWVYIDSLKDYSKRMLMDEVADYSEPMFLQE